MVSLIDLFLVFLRIGFLGFGGPFALLALMEKAVVKQKEWISPEEFAQSTAIGTLTPGPIYFAAAVHIGYKLKGIKGAAITGLASLLPAFLLTVILAFFYIKVQEFPAVMGATKGITSAVIGLFIIMTFRNGKSIVKDYSTLILAAGSFLILELLKINPVWVIIISGLIGTVIYSNPKFNSDKKEEC